MNTPRYFEAVQRFQAAEDRLRLRLHEAAPRAVLEQAARDVIETAALVGRARLENLARIAAA